MKYRQWLLGLLREDVERVGGPPVPAPLDEHAVGHAEKSCGAHAGERPKERVRYSCEGSGGCHDGGPILLSPETESLKARVAREMRESLKAGQKVRLGALRMLAASVKNREVELGHELSDEEFVEVAVREVKRRRESIEEYKKASRPELASKEEAELNVLTAYLPKPLSEAELRHLVQVAVQAAGAKTPQEMGRVMSALMPQIKGRADGKQAQQFRPL